MQSGEKETEKERKSKKKSESCAAHSGAQRIQQTLLSWLILLLLWNVLLGNVCLSLRLLLLSVLLLLLHILLLLGTEFGRAVCKSTAVTPRAGAALPVHADLRLALRAVDANATTAATEGWNSTSAYTAANVATTGNLRNDAHLRWVPVRRLRRMVNVVHLALGGVGLLPPRGQLNRRMCGEICSLHVEQRVVWMCLWVDFN